MFKDFDVGESGIKVAKLKFLSQIYNIISTHVLIQYNTDACFKDIEEGKSVPKVSELIFFSNIRYNIDACFKDIDEGKSVPKVSQLYFLSQIYNIISTHFFRF